jgi:L-threonylcarbamoyladenylate synthase
MVNRAEVGRAVDALQGGGLVVFPTETFYGLAADPWQPKALGRLLELKGRPAQHPLPLILPDREGVARLAAIPARARVLMDTHWPGPLTLVLPALPGLPGPVVGPLGVGVRLSSHPVAAELARRFGGPLTATSANQSGEPPPTRAEAAVGPVECVLAAGELPGGLPSTVVAVAADGQPTLLRAGACHVDL